MSKSVQFCDYTKSFSVFEKGNTVTISLFDLTVILIGSAVVSYLLGSRALILFLIIVLLIMFFRRNMC